MKAENYTLISEQVRENCKQRIDQFDLKDNVRVTLSDARSVSSRQKGLMWIWCRDVANAGIGSGAEDSERFVHLSAKLHFAVPIFCRDSVFFAELWSAWLSNHNNEAAQLWFVKHQVSTSKFSTGQMAEFLTAFQHHYFNLGVNLTDPQDRTLLHRG